MKKSTAILTGVLLMGTTSFAGNYLQKSQAIEKQTVITNLRDTGQTEIEYTKLPANIQYAVKEQYPNFEPKKMATKVEAEGITVYYVTVESDTREIALRCGTDGEIIMQSSSKKSKN